MQLNTSKTALSETVFDRFELSLTEHREHLISFNNRCNTVFGDTIVICVIGCYSVFRSRAYENKKTSNQSKANFTRTAHETSCVGLHRYRVIGRCLMNTLDREYLVHVLQALSDLQLELKQAGQDHDVQSFCDCSDRLRALVRCLDTDALIAYLSKGASNETH
jgi:hypothetical protein